MLGTIIQEVVMQKEPGLHSGNMNMRHNNNGRAAEMDFSSKQQNILKNGPDMNNPFLNNTWKENGVIKQENISRDANNGTAAVKFMSINSAIRNTSQNNMMAKINSEKLVDNLSANDGIKNTGLQSSKGNLTSFGVSGGLIGSIKDIGKSQV